MFAPRITRKFVKNHAGGPCWSYCQHENKEGIYSYRKLLGFWGLTIVEFLLLPIPFRDKMWVLDFQNTESGGFLFKIGGWKLVQKVRSSFICFSVYGHNAFQPSNKTIWSRCRQTNVSDINYRGDPDLPTKTDMSYIVELIGILEKNGVNTGLRGIAYEVWQKQVTK